jgi:hypothetical protein
MRRIPSRPFAFLFLLAAGCDGRSGLKGHPDGSVGGELGGEGGSTVLSGGAGGTGGTSARAASSTCVASNVDLPSWPRCQSDEDCPTSSYCNVSRSVTSRCLCVNGQSQCSEYFGTYCTPYLNNCTRASNAFTDQLKGESCTVILRLDTDRDQVVGYATVCGSLKPTTASAAFDELRPMASINWHEAVLVESPPQTGIIAYTTQFTIGDSLGQHVGQYVAYLSAHTGQLLLITRTAIPPAPGKTLTPPDAGVPSYYSLGTWSPAADLGTTCAPGELQNAFSDLATYAIGDLIMPDNMAIYEVQKTDIYRALRQAQLPTLHQGVALSHVVGTEYLVFITGHRAP